MFEALIGDIECMCSRLALLVEADDDGMFKQLAEMVNELFDDDGVVVALVDTGVDIEGGNDCELLLLPPPVSSEILASSSGSDTFSLLVFIRY